MDSCKITLLGRVVDEEQLKIRPKIKINTDGPLINTRLMISKLNSREK